MKTVNKIMANLVLAGLLFFGLIAPAHAQRGFRFGGFNTIGFRSGVRADVGLHFGGFYHPFVYYPHVGLVIGVLPFGYYPFFWGDYQYYYFGGVFYQDCPDGGYQVVAPPVGAEMPSLPTNAQAINIDGTQYYEFNGVYYKPVVKDNGKTVYVIAGKDGILNTGQNNTSVQANPGMPLVGDMTDQLPANTRKVNLNGKTYWVTPDDIYLEAVKQPNGQTSYRVVSVPAPNDKGQQQPTQSGSGI